MDPGTVERWVSDYVEAWRSNAPDDVEALFTEDARYFTAPYREPWTGRAAIVTGWLGRKDQPGDWEFDHELLAIAGDSAFVRGRTRYSNGDTYSNLWVITFEPNGGRAAEFVEWWMEESTPET